MTVITTLDVKGLTPLQYRAILDRMGVETSPAPGLYLHLTGPISGGYRITEVWDRKEGFEAFLKDRLSPAVEALNIQVEMKIDTQPLHNSFAPRHSELAGLVAGLPGAPKTASTS